MISMEDTLGFDGMKGVFKLATALREEEASRHRPHKKTVYKDQKGSYVSKCELGVGGPLISLVFSCLRTEKFTLDS